MKILFWWPGKDGMIQKIFYKILYKYNRLSIFNGELFLVKLKLCSNNMSEQTFWKLPKFLVYWGKKNISFYTCYTRDLGASWSPIVHKSLCISLCIACLSFGPIHIQYSTLEQKLSWPQVFVVQKLSKFPGRGGTPALWCDGNSSKILNISVVIKPSPPGDAVTSQEWR